MPIPRWRKTLTNQKNSSPQLLYNLSFVGHSPTSTCASKNHMLYRQCSSHLYRAELDNWRKRDVRTNEVDIYELISPHPRILPFFGIDNLTGDALFEYECNGNLWSFLIANNANKVPLTSRLVWAIEIAQGLAHLHHKGIVWADAHFGNILLTEQHHVLLADFAVSVQNPERFHEFVTVPPAPFAWPSHYYGIKPTYLRRYLLFRYHAFCATGLSIPVYSKFGAR
ncbi:hypothetical protein K435DRAFT_971962 [Dendrothele bispora CBS 962.96]|uniref:Protein kinase domain-containing protein n=1 Tax=Dendrothele bispora (strain CBS 962.96) TaxID=1314807 RepID=A0A4S8L200_DENBC|nr:hypothetical protein K435DRAFT_971962 [Dendrothele bispora CBS 962.96]